MENLSVQLSKILIQLELQATEQQHQQLLDLVKQLDKWNKAYNLTSVRNPSDMMVRHIADSLALVKHISPHQRFIDVGTGPGLPGLPLAIMNPNCEFVLLDSLGKRIRFIQQTCFQLKINNVKAVQSRVEDYSDEQGFDCVLSRAFASLEDMLKWCSHLTKNPSGHFFAMKGVYPTAELDKLNSGFNLEQVIELKVPGLNEERHLIDITKVTN